MSALVASLFLLGLACGVHCGGFIAAMGARGTLPWLMGAGLTFAWLQKKMVRAAAGAAALAFGVYGLAHGSDLRGLLCLSGEAS